MNYETDVLETAGGTPATFVSKNLLPTRFRYRVLVHFPAKARLMYFDHQGIERDGGVTRIRATTRYVRYDVYRPDGRFDVTLYNEDNARAYALNAKPAPYVVFRRTVNDGKITITKIAL